MVSLPLGTLNLLTVRSLGGGGSTCDYDGFLFPGLVCGPPLSQQCNVQFSVSLLLDGQSMAKVFVFLRDIRQVVQTRVPVVVLVSNIAQGERGALTSLRHPRLF